jgi:hypothetical protein
MNKSKNELDNEVVTNYNTIQERIALSHSFKSLPEKIPLEPEPDNTGGGKRIF